MRTIGTGDASANFDRGVQCCAFSHATTDGMQLAVIDDSYEHILSVWEWQKGKKIAEIKGSFAILLFFFFLVRLNIFMFLR